MSFLPPDYDNQTDGSLRALFVAGIVVGASAVSILTMICWGFGLFDAR